MVPDFIFFFAVGTFHDASPPVAGVVDIVYRGKG